MLEGFEYIKPWLKESCPSQLSLLSTVEQLNVSPEDKSFFMLVFRETWFDSTGTRKLCLSLVIGAAQHGVDKDSESVQDAILADSSKLITWWEVDWVIFSCQVLLLMPTFPVSPPKLRVSFTSSEKDTVSSSNGWFDSVDFLKFQTFLSCKRSMPTWLTSWSPGSWRSKDLCWSLE